MSELDILKLMNLACCSRETAVSLLERTHNVFEALCLHMEAPLKDKPRTEQQKFFDDARKNLAEIERKSVSKLSGGRSEPLEPDDSKTHLEEMARRKSYSQVCLPPSPESEAEIQAIVCPSLSECSSDLELNTHK